MTSKPTSRAKAQHPQIQTGKNAMTQISTQRDAIEFLTGKWASKPNASYTEKDLENYRRSDVIELAEMWMHENQKAAQKSTTRMEHLEKLSFEENLTDSHREELADLHFAHNEAVKKAKDRLQTAKNIEKIKAAIMTRSDLEILALIIMNEDKCTFYDAKERAEDEGADAAKAAIHKFAKEHF
jgi:DNA-binding TFAR19-related protein (PDSD5 family)